MSGPYSNFQRYDSFYGSQHGAAMPQANPSGPSLSQQRISVPDFSPQSQTPLRDSANATGTSSTGVRARRRISATGEHVKHRRTRSGCYTCRNRRIKCDETRPICDRCKKGNRDCVYPESGLSSKTKRRDSRATRPARVNSLSSPSSDDADRGFEDDGPEELAPLPEDEDLPDTDSQDFARPPAKRHNSSTLSLVQAKSPGSSNGEAPSILTQATEVSSASIDSLLSQQQPRTLLTTRDQRWTDFPRDVEFYLNFFKTNINNYHYAFKYDYDDYLQTTFLDFAICYERLLYAVISFSAYLYSVQRKEGKIQDFLAYYNKSVTLLRLSLVKRQQPNLATLMTILQLATIEEFLGDWVSLLSHQKAALQIFTCLFTPHNIMQSETSRKVLDWYLRFDLVVGMLSGNGSSLGREWYEVRCEYYQRLSQQEPNNLGCLYKERSTENGIICTDAASLWAGRNKGLISEEEFNSRADEIAMRLTEYKARIPSLIMHNSRITINSNGNLQQDFANFVGPVAAKASTAEAFWSGSLMLLDWWAVEMMFKHQLSGVRRQPPPAEIGGLAFEMLKTFESMETHADKPMGIMIAAQGSVGVAGLFVPKDYSHSMWVRRKLATVESFGYTYPRAFRQKMSAHWNADLTHWWLPNEEGFPPLLRAIRSLIHDRSEGPQTDELSENVRDMRGVFSNIRLDENAPVESPSSITHPHDDKSKSRSSSAQDFNNVTIVNNSVWDAAEMPITKPTHWQPPKYG